LAKPPITENPRAATSIYMMPRYLGDEKGESIGKCYRLQVTGYKLQGPLQPVTCNL
jgi:hypothetical protein